MNMCDVGTPLQRLHGRRDNTPILEFGDKILYMPAEPAKGGEKWEPRFHPGVFVEMLEARDQGSRSEMHTEEEQCRLSHRVRISEEHQLRWTQSRIRHNTLQSHAEGSSASGVRPSATTSTDQNTGTKVCLQLWQCDEGIECCVVLGEEGHQVFSRRVSLVQRHQALAHLAFSDMVRVLAQHNLRRLLPATGQDKRPSCNWRSLKRPRMKRRKCLGRALLRAIRDAVATATRKPRCQVLAQGRDATTHVAQVLPEEFAAARFSDIVDVQSHSLATAFPLNPLRLVVLMSQLGIAEGPRPHV